MPKITINYENTLKLMLLFGNCLLYLAWRKRKTCERCLSFCSHLSGSTDPHVSWGVVHGEVEPAEIPQSAWLWLMTDTQKSPFSPKAMWLADQPLVLLKPLVTSIFYEEKGKTKLYRKSPKLSLQCNGVNGRSFDTWKRFLKHCTVKGQCPFKNLGHPKCKLFMDWSFTPLTHPQYKAWNTCVHGDFKSRSSPN